MKEGHPNYISYTVIGEDKLGSFEVSKRYSNFCELRDKWVQSWPGCYIPSLPQKMFKVKNHSPFRAILIIPR